MKTKSFIAALLCVLAIAATAQVPQDIKTAVTNKYPQATVKSIKLKGNRYVAKLVLSGTKCMAVFDNSGNWVKTTTAKKWRDMPDAVRIGLHRSTYSNWEVYTCNEVDSPKGILYSFDVDNQYTLSGDRQPAFEEERYVYFTPDGNLVKVKNP